MRIIKIKFVGIDSWNRPIYKSINGKQYFGSIDTLFPFGEKEEAQEYIRNNVKELVYFGKYFDCEPYGIHPNNFEEPAQLEIVEDIELNKNPLVNASSDIRVYVQQIQAEKGILQEQNIKYKNLLSNIKDFVQKEIDYFNHDIEYQYDWKVLSKMIEDTEL